MFTLELCLKFHQNHHQLLKTKVSHLFKNNGKTIKSRYHLSIKTHHWWSVTINDVSQAYNIPVPSANYLKARKKTFIFLSHYLIHPNPFIFIHPSSSSLQTSHSLDSMLILGTFYALQETKQEATTTKTKKKTVKQQMMKMMKEGKGQP